MIGLIYTFTNKENGLQYVGQTYKDINVRVYQHLYDATKRNCGGKFYNAIRKYGIDSFDIDILHKVECGDINELVGILNKLEYDEINYRNTITNGYNTERGGRNSNYRNGDKISKTKLNSVYSNSNPIEQYDLDGKLIATYETTMQAQRATGANNGHILKVCRGIRKTHKGFIWKFGHIKSGELREHPVKS